MSGRFRNLATGRVAKETIYRDGAVFPHRPTTSIHTLVKRNNRSGCVADKSRLPWWNLTSIERRLCRLDEAIVPGAVCVQQLHKRITGRYEHVTN